MVNLFRRTAKESPRTKGSNHDSTKPEIRPRDVDEPPEIRRNEIQNGDAHASHEEPSNTEERVWAKILADVSDKSTKKLERGKRVVILGDNSSGKSTLLARLKGEEDAKKGQALEYHCIEIKDTHRDEQTKLGVWVLDGDLHHGGLLRYALPVEAVTSRAEYLKNAQYVHDCPDSLVVITLSMATPWAVMDSLDKWTQLLSRHLDRLPLSLEERRKNEENLKRYIQNYAQVDNLGTSLKSSIRTSSQDSTSLENDDLVALGPDALTCNLGVPIVVVVTMTDVMASLLEKDFDYREEHFDFIQLHMRRFCLSLGASLVYTSVKTDRNCDVLLDHLLQRLYGLGGNHVPNLVDRDAIFIPTGWDSERKMSILRDSLSSGYASAASLSPDAAFVDVILRPTHLASQRSRQRLKELEITTEEEQVFLTRQQQLLIKAIPGGSVRTDSTGATSTSRGPSEAGVAAGVPKTLERRSLGSPGVSTSSSPRSSPSMTRRDLKAGIPTPAPLNVSHVPIGGVGMSGSQVPQETVLASFFNSLLSKKSGTTGASGSSEAASAELEKLSQKKDGTSQHR